MTLPEVLLWQRIRGSAGGVSFRKQHPIDPYVVDFYCSGSKPIIEIDGQAHDRGDRPGRDERRDAFLRERGYRLLRIAATDVLKGPRRCCGSGRRGSVGPPPPPRFARRSPSPCRGGS
ncbi:MAG TPA: endonuclease domain-containing protein [Allosphingosinicella sp.]|jgi:very-short-patch-repair endonuclease